MMALGVGEVLWWMTNEPIEAENYEPVFDVDRDGVKTYATRWGRSVFIGLILNTFQALPMTGKLLLIYICNFHVLSHLLLINICKLHWIIRTIREDFGSL